MFYALHFLKVNIKSSLNLKIFLRLRSQSLKIINFDGRQRKFKNNTGVYLQNFLQYNAKFIFLNLVKLVFAMLKGVYRFRRGF